MAWMAVPLQSGMMDALHNCGFLVVLGGSPEALIIVRLVRSYALFKGNILVSTFVPKSTKQLLFTSKIQQYS